MVAKVQLTTTVEDDGSVRLSESQIQPAGLRAGDRVRIEIVKDPELPKPSPAPNDSSALDVDALAALPFNEWLSYGRSMVSLDGLTVEEIRQLAEQDAADEFWERFNRGR